jgi:hypothetical protein
MFALDVKTGAILCEKFPDDLRPSFGGTTGALLWMEIG